MSHPVRFSLPFRSTAPTALIRIRPGGWEIAQSLAQAGGPVRHGRSSSDCSAARNLQTAPKPRVAVDLPTAARRRRLGRGSTRILVHNSASAIAGPFAEIEPLVLRPLIDVVASRPPLVSSGAGRWRGWAALPGDRSWLSLASRRLVRHAAKGALSRSPAPSPGNRAPASPPTPWRPSLRPETNAAYRASPAGERIARLPAKNAGPSRTNRRAARPRSPSASRRTATAHRRWRVRDVHG